MTLEDEIRHIAEQERRLELPRFDETDAWKLGTILKTLAESRGQAVFVEIRKVRETVFAYAMPGTGPNNIDWARRKRNAVELLQRSSYGIGRTLQRDNTSLETRMGLPTRDYASHGGGFPIKVAGVGVVGAVTVSGLPQRDDHDLVVEALAQMAGVPLAEIALPVA